MYVALAVTAGTLCVLSLLPLWQHPHWLVRDAEFARLQLLLLLLACLVAQILVLPRGSPGGLAVLAATLFCALWNLWHLRRYLVVWRSEVPHTQATDPERRLSVLSANVQMENRDVSRLLALAADYSPDLLVTMESDQWWQDRLAVLEEAMPHTVKCPLDNRYGMHLYSRLPLDDARIEYIVEDDVPSIHAVVILASGARVQLHLLHPAPPSPTENSESEERDAELIVVAKRLADDRRPILVAGDFNDIPWSRAAQLFRRISGLCDPRVGRGLFNTFHAGVPLLRWPLDHVYHSPHFELVRIQRLGNIGSDHFPLYVCLALANEGCGQEQPEATDSELAEARELVSSGTE